MKLLGPKYIHIAGSKFERVSFFKRLFRIGYSRYKGYIMPMHDNCRCITIPKNG